MAGNRLLGEIVRRHGGRLLDRAVSKALPVDPAAKPRRKTMLGGIATVIATRVATRSIPGAIVVGGAVLAKKLYDRRHAASAPEDAGKTEPET